MSVKNSRINYILVSKDDEQYRAGFVAAFKEAFGGPPYNETYTDRQVIEEIWNPNYELGVVILALNGEEVVGFSCGMPIQSAPEEIREYLRKSRGTGVNIPDPADTWYMSELGVLNRYRGQGIGTQLVGQKLAHIILRGGRHYTLRTAAEGSRSRNIYESIGSVVIPGRQDVSSSEQVLVNKSQSRERMYLYGNCATALARIFIRN